MKKTYKCSNVKFCMEDENQRRTWEYLQTLTRKDGSYGKVLSEAFVSTLDLRNSERMAEKVGVNRGELAETLVQMLRGILEERLQSVQEALAEQIKVCFQDYAIATASVTGEDGQRANVEEAEQMQEYEMSEDMMAFAFGMGE